jgi:hypothetical protein
MRLPERRLEAEADRAAQLAAAGRPVGSLAGVAASGAAQCKPEGAALLPTQPTAATARALIRVDWQTYLVVDVQWHFDKLTMDRTFDLVVQGAHDRRRQLSSALSRFQNSAMVSDLQFQAAV